MGQSQETKQKWKGPKNFDIYFSAIFGCYDHQIGISGRKTWHLALHRTDFVTFLKS